MPYIGIDFGTSNSVVADFQFGRPVVLPNHEGQSATPSVVTLRRDGSLAFGQEAKENFDANRSIRSIKRVLGSGSRVRGGLALRHSSNRWLSCNKSSGTAVFSWAMPKRYYSTLHRVTHAYRKLMDVYHQRANHEDTLLYTSPVRISLSVSTAFSASPSCS